MKFNDLCKNKKEIRLGYIGGSITEDDKYRSCVLKNLTAEYPDNTFVEIKGGVSGTPSYLGVHRIDRDILAHEPDVVFIEFSVNDDYGRAELFKRSLEGMIRKILNRNPNAIIAVLGSSTEWYMKEYYWQGKTPEMMLAHMEVAEYYSIPYINMGKALSDYFLRTGAPVNEYLPDGIHPNFAGGKIYADEIMNFLYNYQWNIEFKKEPLTHNNLEKATLFSAENYVAEPWKVSDCDMMGKHPLFIYSDEVGAELELDFFGSVFGLYCTYDGDSGNLEYCVDGKEWKEVSLWDMYCLSFNRVCFSVLESDLERTYHHIKMRISANKNEQSKGNAIRIGAFLWEKE